MIRMALAFALISLVVSACGPAKPLVHDIAQPDEMKPGPGLFSGKDGKFILYRDSYRYSEDE